MTTVNPIIPGFAPDPSIIRVDDTYFLTNSSFHFFPGLPIYASKDLVSWKHIGDALNRPEQLSLLRTPSKLSLWAKREIMVGNRGLYAPTIRYDRGTFYIVCTTVRGEADSQQDTGHHFILSSTDIYANEWSEPVHFEFPGGDPSLYFEDGRAYVQIGCAEDFSVHQFEINPATGEALTAPKQIWADQGRKWTESPHIYKKDGYYHLLIAEAGTFESHMISVARARDLWGPYEGHPNNPILTAFGTSNYIQHVGHGDFVEDVRGDWWMVCLGVRKRGGSFVLGRETFLTPVEWLSSGWPKISPVTMECKPGGSQPHALVPCDESQMRSLPAAPGFVHIREYDPKSYRMDSEDSIVLYPGASDLSEPNGPVAFIGRRQRSLDGISSVQMQVLSAREGYRRAHFMAGLAIYKEELRYFRIFYDSETAELCFEALNKAIGLHVVSRSTAILASPEITLRIRHTELLYEFCYRLTPEGEDVVLGSLDAVQMTNLDFVGPVVGLFAVAKGEGDGDRTGVELTNFKVA